MGAARRVTLLRRLERQEGVNHLRMAFRVGPILRDLGPLRAEPFLIGIAVLGNERVQPLRMRQHHPETHGGAVVVNV